MILKTLNVVVLGDRLIVNDDEWKAEVYSCASDRQQAAIVFDVACDMVRQSPALSKRIKIVPSTKRMTCGRNKVF